jgi:hypothetical protein
MARARVEQAVLHTNACGIFGRCGPSTTEPILTSTLELVCK